MALSRTEVINAALLAIGVRPIADPDERSEAAYRAKDVYNTVVRSELEKYPWFFAKRAVRLAASATAPLLHYERAFLLPTDFIRLVELEDRWVFDVLRGTPNVDPIPTYVVTDRYVHSDFAAPLGISYIADLTEDPPLWTPLFTRAVTYALAEALAFPLTKSDGVTERMSRLYDKAVTAARRSSAMQQPTQHVPDGSWLASRRS